MDVDAGVEEKKGEERSAPAAVAVPAERTQKGKGEGDRNIMLHPVCSCSSLRWRSRLPGSPEFCGRVQSCGACGLMKILFYRTCLHLCYSRLTALHSSVQMSGLTTPAVSERAKFEKFAALRSCQGHSPLSISAQHREFAVELALLWAS